MSSDFVPDVEKRFNRPLGRGAEISSGRSSSSCDIARIQLSRQKSVAEAKIVLSEIFRLIDVFKIRSSRVRSYSLTPNAETPIFTKGISLDSAAPDFEEVAYELALFNTFPTAIS